MEVMFVVEIVLIVILKLEVTPCKKKTRGY